MKIGMRIISLIVISIFCIICASVSAQINSECKDDEIFNSKLEKHVYPDEVKDTNFVNHQRML